MKKGIKLSKEYGVNPSMLQCFCCGKEYAIALFGDSYKDKNGKRTEAPKVVCTGDICDDCKKVIDKGGIFFIECTNDSNENNPYRTGRLVAVKEDWCKETLNKYNKINYMPEEVFSKLFQINQTNEEKR